MARRAGNLSEAADHLVPALGEVSQVADLRWISGNYAREAGALLLAAGMVEQGLRCVTFADAIDARFDLGPSIPLHDCAEAAASARARLGADATRALVAEVEAASHGAVLRRAAEMLGTM